MKRLLAVLFAAAMLLAACGNDDSDNGADQGTGDETPETTAAPGETGDGAEDDFTASLRIGFPGEAGFASLPVLIAIDRLNAEGWDIEIVNIDDTSVLTEALLSGEIQIAVATANETARVTQLGQPLAVVGLRSAQDWIVVASDDVDSCDDLDGTRVAYHSESAASAHMLRNWISEECGAEPDYLVMAGSTNRAVALQAGQIDATIVQIEDWLPLGVNGEVEGAYVLADMASGLPNLATSTYSVQRGWIDSDRETVVRFLAAAIQATRDVGDDPDILRDAAATHLGESLDSETLDLLIEEYTSRGLWAATEDGGLDEEALQYTIDFLTSTEVIEAGLTPAEFGDLEVLREAVARLDG